MRWNVRFFVLAVSTALITPIPAAAQDPGDPAQGQRLPAADPADVGSIDAIIAALYDVISGPAGEARDWDRFRSLFLEGARLVPAQSGPDGQVHYRELTPNDYVELAGPQLEESGFFEVEIGRTLERFGNVAHAFSAYEGRRAVDDPEPFVRGINSIQLIYDGERWWLANLTWDSERPETPIPERYLRPGG